MSTIAEFSSNTIIYGIMNFIDMQNNCISEIL